MVLCPAAYLGLVLSADPDGRAIIDSSRRPAIQATGEILDLDLERPAVRLAMRSWIAAVNEAAVVWLQDRCSFPADDLIEVLMVTLAELLRQGRTLGRRPPERAAAAPEGAAAARSLIRTIRQPPSAVLLHGGYGQGGVLNTTPSRKLPTPWLPPAADTE
ncbi:hypothetical protein FHR32_007698 [Streptosporangium album]|uniref:Uncharacterized protein n=1 Tax=Streptosporangium album TaxID=47479 RepID=A0A7W7S4V7_9ACTN|nr:hypothetical protein [Streptosporangium album]MBB4943298.1 hypothetical protein [Streptosporangium album]